MTKTSLPAKNKRNVTFAWDIHWSCNYRCPYCFHNGKWEEMARSNAYPGIPRLIEALKQLHRAYGTCTLHIAGGEPLTYPGFSDILNAACALHRVTVITNLSSGLQDLAGLTKKLPAAGTLTVQPSFHPTHTDPDTFIQKIELLANSGIRLKDTTLVGWPPVLKDVTRYRDIFRARSLRISVTDFWGDYEGRPYPFSYTDEEKRFIRAFSTTPEEAILSAPPTTRGMLCAAGYSYAILRPNGDVFRCGGRGFEGRESAIGNIFSGGPPLFAEPQPCDMEHCRCGQFRVHEL